MIVTFIGEPEPNYKYLYEKAEDEAKQLRNALMSISGELSRTRDEDALLVADLQRKLRNTSQRCHELQRDYNSAAPAVLECEDLRSLISRTRDVTVVDMVRQADDLQKQLLSTMATLDTVVNERDEAREEVASVTEKLNGIRRLFKFVRESIT